MREMATIVRSKQNVWNPENKNQATDRLQAETDANKKLFCQ